MATPLLLVVCLATLDTGASVGGLQPTSAIARNSKLKELPMRSKLSVFRRRMAMLRRARTYSEPPLRLLSIGRFKMFFS